MKSYYLRSLKADMDIESIVEMSLTMTKTNMIIGMSIIWSFQVEKYAIFIVKKLYLDQLLSVRVSRYDANRLKNLLFNSSADIISGNFYSEKDGI